LPKSLLASTGWKTHERAAHHVEKKLTACLLVTHESGTLTGPVKHREGGRTRLTPEPNCAEFTPRS
jgi:hypothetical protein